MPTAIYKVNGKRVPGVTTIGNRFQDPGGLFYYFTEQGQKYPDIPTPEAMRKKSGEAANIGTGTHGCIELHVNGEPPERAIPYLALSDKDRKKAWNAFNQYLTWEKQSGIKLLSKYQEINLVSEEYEFGGTPDALGMIGNELVLLDWKTSNGVFPSYAVQLAAYGHLVAEGKRLDTGEPLGLGEVQGFHLLRIAKDYPDFEHRYFGELDLAWEQFKLFRQAYENDKELKKRVK